MTFMICDGGTGFSMFCALLDLRSLRQDVTQENPGTLFNEKSKRCENSEVRLGKLNKADLQEKPLSFSIIETVPQTDTGVQLE